MLAMNDPRVVQFVALIHGGDVEGLRTHVALHPSLATERFGDEAMSTTAVHIATDWPGHFPRVAESIAALVEMGADVNARFLGPHQETPLHWSASSDDVNALDALLDAGADIEATGAVFTDGTPLSDAVVFAQWNAARRLVERGASMTIWQAAALGEYAEVTRHLELGATMPPEITNACWHACRAGQFDVVKVLAEHGPTSIGSVTTTSPCGKPELLRAMPSWPNGSG